MIVFCGHRVSNQSVWAYNDDGTFAWSFDTGGNAYFAGIDSGGRIMIGCYPVDLGDGYGACNLRFLNTSGVQVHALYVAGSSTNSVYSVKIDSRGYYYVCASTRLAKYDPNWNFVANVKTGYTISDCCFDDDDNIYFTYTYSSGSVSGYTEKQDFAGNILWTTPLDSDLQSSTSIVKLVDGDIVVCNRYDHITKRLSEVDGSLVWRVTTGRFVGTSSITHFVNPNDKLIYAAGASNLYTFDPSDGSMISYPTSLPYTRLLIPKLATIWSNVGTIVTENTLIFPHGLNAASMDTACRLTYFDTVTKERVYLSPLSDIPSSIIYGATFTDDSQLYLADDKFIMESQLLDDAADLFRNTRWFAQIFQVDEPNEVTSVGIRHTLYSATINVSIQSVVDGVPSGVVLASASEPTGSDTVAYVRLYRFATPVTLSPGVDYAIVVSTTSTASHTIETTTASPYSHKTYYSTDSGANWVEFLNESLWFIVQGRSGLPAKPINPDPADSDVGTDFSDYTLSWDDGGNTDTYDVYVGESAGDLTLVSSAQIGTSLVIPEAYRLARTVSTWYWRVDANNAHGTTTGDVWSFSPYWIPEITDQSESYSVVTGARVTLFVTATGIPSPTYQWYKDGSLVSGAINVSYTFFAVTNHLCFCRVTNVMGYVDSSPIVISVGNYGNRYNILNLQLDLGSHH